jgi:hypothetical protein
MVRCQGHGEGDWVHFRRTERMTKKTLYMEYTEVPAERTAAEVVSELVRMGANQINTEYDQGVITGLRWIMRINGTDVLFAMPARVEPVYKILLKRRRDSYRKDIQDAVRLQSRRVAWRQLLRWTQSQLAMIECGMAEAGEVFFPYLQTPEGRSIFDTWKEHGVRMLPQGGPQ